MEWREKKNETSSIRIEGLPETFVFTSGADGWSTEMTISDDWSFAGQFHDSDMGDTGDGYPNGTLYISDFSGTFSGQERMSSYALKMKSLSVSQKIRPLTHLSGSSAAKPMTLKRNSGGFL